MTIVSLYSLNKKAIGTENKNDTDGPQKNKKQIYEEKNCPAGNRRVMHTTLS
jgi:hypothetical protein